MDKLIIEAYGVETLAKGYVKSDEQYECIWCGHLSNAEAWISKHVSEMHPPQYQFYQLLNADSILHLSFAEKKILTAMFNGQRPEMIADDLSLKASTIRSMRRNLNDQYQRAKLECLVFEMAFTEQPKRKYAKSQKERDVMIVNIDKDNNVIGSFSKAEIHDPQEPKYHPTTLVLPVKIGDEGLRLFIGDKNPKVYKRRAQDLLNGDHLNTSDEFWDCCGGHVEEQDLSKDKTVVDSEAFNHAAWRELSEELVLKGTAVEPEKLIGPLAIVEYGPATMPDAGVNHEQSAVYAALLPQNAEVTLRDDYLDTLGEHVVANFVTRSVSFDQLMEMHHMLPEHFMDGLGRICAYFDANDFTEERLLASIKALDKVAAPLA
jgi:hypothetical protein